MGTTSDVELPPITSSAPPEGADTLKVDVGRIDIVGGRRELSAPAEEIRARLSGRRVPLSEIYAGAAELEQAYASAGFPLVRVTLPPQRLVPGGAVQLSVIDGYIETVDVSGLPWQFRNFVRARVATLIGKRGVTAAEIERAVLLAGDARGLMLRSAIKAGEGAGGTKLILEGDAKLVTGTLSIDNDLPKTLGTWQSSVSLALNSVFGFGEQEYILLGTALDGQPGLGLHAPVAIFGFGLNLPLGEDGATVLADYTRSLTRPKSVPGAPTIVGTFERATLRLDYPLIRSRLETLSVDASVDYIAQVNALPQLATDLDRDRYRAFRVGASWQRTLPSSNSIVVRLQLSQGLGGRDAGDATSIPLSRTGTSPNFTKLNADSQLSELLGGGLFLRLLARGQYSFDTPVFVSEQFALDAADGVSGFPAGSSSVDSGASLRAEVTRPSLSNWPIRATALTPYVFADIAKGWLAQPTAAEVAGPVIGSFGLGLRLEFQESVLRGAGLNIELARRYSNIAGQRSGNRISVNITERF